MHSKESKFRCICESDRKNRKFFLKAAIEALYPFYNSMQISIREVLSGRFKVVVFYGVLFYSKGFRRSDNGGNNRLKMQIALHTHITLRCGHCVQYSGQNRRWIQEANRRISAINHSLLIIIIIMLRMNVITVEGGNWDALTTVDTFL
jgi:hypothetical protein